MQPINQPPVNYHFPSDSDPNKMEFPLPDTEMLIRELHYLEEHKLEVKGVDE